MGLPDTGLDNALMCVSLILDICAGNQVSIPPHMAQELETVAEFAGTSLQTWVLASNMQTAFQHFLWYVYELLTTLLIHNVPNRSFAIAGKLENRQAVLQTLSSSTGNSPQSFDRSLVGSSLLNLGKELPPANRTLPPPFHHASWPVQSL
jgi:hypothetical protein